MSKIDEARKILGDDYVIVHVKDWNAIVEEIKNLQYKMEQAEKSLNRIL